jgi:four helix bundle protein
MTVKTESLDNNDAWKKSIHLARVVDEFIKSVDRNENYTIIEPMHRISINLTTDLSKALGRDSQDAIYDYKYARGDVFTLMSLAVVAKELGYVEDNTGILLEIEHVKRAIDKSIEKIESENTEKP